MDVGMRGDVKVGPPTTGAGVQDAEGPSQRVQEMATHNGEEASLSETTGAKDTVEQATQTRNATCMQAEAA